ncbi:MAG: CDP-glycerol glycerophosphotransferase family protein, partial [Lachnospiraceae bacterium]|nr:CDP-glycerol glycerophosphotransferase family protein [Lachnospiraceae bacterium]
MHDKLAFLIKHTSVIQFFYRYIMSFVFRFIGLFIRTDEKLILFNSYGGDRYDDSPQVLYEAIKKDDRFAGYHFVWAFCNPVKFNKEKYPEIWNAQTKLVKIDSLSYFIAALKAKVWITNVNIERGLHFKKKKTIYLNTWHGTGPKKSGNAIAGRRDYDFSYVDIICVDGKHSRDSMVKWFNAK